MAGGPREQTPARDPGEPRNRVPRADYSVRALLIAGPTASGKSALAARAAEAADGEVINADSMQLYKELHVLTARPSAEDEAPAPHHLYGVLAGNAPASAAAWAGMARAAVEAIEARGRLPILVGGTGLYFKALTDGLADIPEIPAAIRHEVREEVARGGAAAAHEALSRLDAELAKRLAPNDAQRIARGLEVVRATGKPLSEWQSESVGEALQGPLAKLVLAPERDALNTRIDKRFDRMMAKGALEEVRALAALDYDPALPVMKALGVTPLRRHLAGEISLSQAVEEGKVETRRYAKRQATWARTQMISWERVLAQDLESFIDHLMSKILLTR